MQLTRLVVDRQQRSITRCAGGVALRGCLVYPHFLELAAEEMRALRMDDSKAEVTGLGPLAQLGAVELFEAPPSRPHRRILLVAQRVVADHARW